MMKEIFYRGTALKIKFCFNTPSEGYYILAETFDDDFIFQIICISGYKAGISSGYIRKDNLIPNIKGVTKNHLFNELDRNFLNLDKNSIVIYPTIELDGKFPQIDGV